MTTKNGILIAIALMAVWAIFGLLDNKNSTYLGYSTDFNNAVIEVDEGSPAEAAGLQVGDVLKSIGGIDIDDSKGFNQQERSKIGETRTWIVDRDGEEVSVDITYGSLPTKSKMLNWIGLLIGIIYIFYGVRSYFKSPAKHTFLFALFGLCLGFSFLDNPYFSDPAVRNIVNAITLPILLFGFAFLLQFMLHYPKERGFLQKGMNNKLIYAPALLMSLFFMFVILTQPDNTTGLRTVFRFVFPLFILFYFGWALVAMIQNHSRASAEERTSHGLNLMKWGALITIVPLLLSVLVNALAPSVIIPGSDYIFIVLAAIPITFGMALDT